MSPPARIAACIAIVVSFTGCASWQAPRCQAAEKPAVQETLYFGTAKPHGVVSVDEWRVFLAEQVAPRFPAGFTLLQASGRWRGADGRDVDEATHVLQVVHDGGAGDDASIAAIVQSYKTRFQQEAVMRSRARVCVSF